MPPSGKQTRNCTNAGTCSDLHDSPKIEQNCTYASPEIKEELEEDEDLGKKNATEENKGTEEIIQKESTDMNRIFIYPAIILTILSVVFYLKKDYFKRLVKKTK